MNVFFFRNIYFPFNVYIQRWTVVKYFYSALKVNFSSVCTLSECLSLENFYFTTFQSIIFYFLPEVGRVLKNCTQVKVKVLLEIFTQVKVKVIV